MHWNHSCPTVGFPPQSLNYVVAIALLLLLPVPFLIPQQSFYAPFSCDGKWHCMFPCSFHTPGIHKVSHYSELSRGCRIHFFCEIPFQGILHIQTLIHGCDIEQYDPVNDFYKTFCCICHTIS